MTFEDWIEWNWKPVSSDDKYILANEREKAETVGKILENFTKTPTSVGRISRDTFMTMPINKHDRMAWPDFTPVLRWMEENCSDEWFQYDVINYLFVDPADAMAFVLRWG